MKRVEELGISPSPWHRYNQFVIANDDGSVVAASNYNDARLIAAAPELYECLREALQTVAYTSPVNHAKWREVLAKASGEEVQ